MGFKRRFSTPESEYSFRVKVMMSVSKGANWTEASKRFGVPKQTLYAWNKLLAEDGWSALFPQTPNLQALHRSAERGNVAQVLVELDAGFEIDAVVSHENDTLLHVAAEKGHEDLAEALVARGANVEALAGNPAIWTPLQCAIRQANISICHRLINSGANIHAAKGTSWPPLLLASSEELFGLVELLLKLGASPLVCDIDQHMTPLHYAARAGRATLVKQLLKAGADSAAKADANTDGEGRTALDLARAHNHAAVVEILS